MQRDMKDLEEKAAASAKSAEYERNLARQLENDLKKVCAELDRCRTGVKEMTQRILGELCSFLALYFCCQSFALLY